MERLSEQETTEYFSEALNLFRETQWLYNTPVTEILSNGSLDAFPSDWLDALTDLDNQEFNDLVARKIVKPVRSEALKAFVEKCVRLNRLPIKSPSSPVQLPYSFTIGLSFKKQHEIVHLARLVHAQCASAGITVIVDLGAGLGYICQLLYYLYGYRVLGLEKSESNVSNARLRQAKMYPESLEHVKYACCDLTCDSAETIQSILSTEFQDSEKFCLIGLHACGDLSIHASKIFRDMEAAQIFILISCCYHKLSVLDVKTEESSEKQYFCNFPLSRELRGTIDTLDLDVGCFLRQPFLRLACQEPADRWCDMSEDAHAEHSFHVLARAVLQLYATENGLYLKKRVQKGTRKSQCLNFGTYVKDSLLRYTLEPIEQKEIKEKNEDDLEVHEKNITELWNLHCDKLKIAELYTGLQLMLQAPAESLVLQDRLSWMKEQGLEATIVPVMNNRLSPRSYAIVSRKR